MNVSDELIELRGLRFHYRDWPARASASPRANAPTLLLLHGYTGHSRSWDTFASAMTDRYRVLALDQRGHGETAWAPPDQYGTDEMAADLRAFVQALGLSAYTLLGLSMGGMVSIRYAGDQPRELERLVIVDIGPVIETSGMSRIQTGVRANDVFDSKEAAFAAARAVTSLPPEAEHRHRVYNNLMRLADGRWTYRYDRALREGGPPRLRPSVEDGWKSVANIAVPTLILRGATSDILSPATAERMRSTIKTCTLVEVPNAGHSIPLDNPVGFINAARGWL